MADPVVYYPFDPTGQAVSNRIVGEQIIVIPPGDRLFHFTMPRFAPFFEEGLVVKIRDVNNNVITLTKGVDYYLSHKFMDASLATMHPIYGSISFLKRTIVGTLIVDYNTLGGVWNIDQQQITEILMNTVRNPRIVAWEQVVERPIDFPVIDHPWNLDDMVGQKEILEVLQNFYEAYLASLDPDGGGGGGGIIAEHINNKNNPHSTTAAQVGAYSIIQINSMLTGYLTTTGTAADSGKFGGRTVPQFLSDVVATKVNAAGTADTATNATNAANAANSAKLENQTLAQVLASAAAQTSANSTKFGGKTYTEATADILAGKAADSGMLEGKTLSQIIEQLQQSTGDAATLNGKNLLQIMADVKATKVDLALRADTAGDSDTVGGMTVAQILGEFTGAVPDNAHNAEKVYNFTFEELIENILNSDTFYEGKPWIFDLFDIENAPVVNPGTGGTADNTFTYTMLGEFAIPLTGPGNDKFDTAARRISTAFDVLLFSKTRTDRMKITATIGDDQSITMQNFSDTLLTGQFQVGTRSVNSPITSVDGTVTAKYNQVWLRWKTTQELRKYGVSMPFHNSFVLDTADEPHVWNSTHGPLNTVTWASVNLPGQLADTITDTQKAFDDLADAIDLLLATPAA